MILLVFRDDRYPTAISLAGFTGCVTTDAYIALLTHIYHVYLPIPIPPHLLSTHRLPTTHVGARYGCCDHLQPAFGDCSICGAEFIRRSLCTFTTPHICLQSLTFFTFALPTLVVHVTVVCYDFTFRSTLLFTHVATGSSTTFRSVVDLPHHTIHTLAVPAHDTLHRSLYV